MQVSFLWDEPPEETLQSTCLARAARVVQGFPAPPSVAPGRAWATLLWLRANNCRDFKHVSADGDKLRTEVSHMEPMRCVFYRRPPPCQSFSMREASPVGLVVLTMRRITSIELVLGKLQVRVDLQPETAGTSCRCTCSLWLRRHLH